MHFACLLEQFDSNSIFCSLDMGGSEIIHHTKLVALNVNVQKCYFGLAQTMAANGWYTRKASPDLAC